MENQSTIPTILLSRAAYAKLKGVAPRTIGKYVQDGVLPLHNDKLNPAECDRILDEYLLDPLGSGRQPGNTGKLPGGRPTKKQTGNEVEMDYDFERTKEKRLKVALLELELSLKQGEMTLTKDVEFAAFTAAREIRDKMLNIPDQISAIVAAETDEIKVRELIMDAIEDGLTDVADAYNRHKELNNGDKVNQ